MAMVDLKGTYRVTAKGRTYWYAWRGGPRLHGEPGSEQFIRELVAARESRKGGDKQRMNGLIVDFKASDAWTKLADSTRKSWKGPLDEVQAYFGPLRIKVFETPEVRRTIKQWRARWKDTPRAADMHKQVLSAVLSYAVEECRLSSNPCFGIANLYRNDRSELIWTEDDLARFEMLASQELTWALRLACLTGLRQADLLKLSWSHVGALAVEMRTGKSRGRKTASVPMYADLEALLAEIPRRATTVLTNSDGLPWKTGFGSSWNKAMKLLGETALHFHDARGTFATTTYSLGVFSIRELAEMLAWSEDKVERIINRYVRKDALMRDRIRRMDAARRNTQET